MISHRASRILLTITSGILMNWHHGTIEGSWLVKKNMEYENQKLYISACMGGAVVLLFFFDQ